MGKLICQYRVFILMLVSVLFVPNICGAQSVVGKWQRNMSHMFTIDKATGKQVFVSEEYQKQYDAATAENGYKEILEMKSDNTYTSTATAGGKQTVHSGKYSLSGKTLDMNIPLVKGQKTVITVISITGTTMIWNLVFMDKSNGIRYDRM
jgi:Lipocalin-like domain